MKIVDNKDLIPDYNVLLKVIESHPLSKNLLGFINNLRIKLSERCGIADEKINLDMATNDVTLYIGKDTPSKSNYKYILYHEFSHIADKLNPDFKYSDELRDSLSETESTCVVELWNIYIDARLNDHNLFELGHQHACIATIDGQLTRLPKGVEGKLMEHMATLERCGMDHNISKNLVEKVWQNPEAFISYEDLINIVSLNVG